ncbi:MAG: response regulator [Timaviella obliquedivisa GSE-PSE-MK23-08B]|jgi:CheY-like chemotaxis protein|nr:response regulator [Timaviella obliquedivisa GSE-PSE-MK23-08B]
MIFSEEVVNPSEPFDLEGSYCDLPEALLRDSNQPFVLCVDDNPDDLLLLSYTVEFCNIEFIGRASGWAALKLVAILPPALILLDILLPDLNGIDFLYYLKQNPLTCDIPVVAVTALATLSDRALLLSAGFVDYISKPYMLEEVEEVILRHLKSKSNQGE